jgi:ADP-ribose pyrophosphatase
MKLVDKNRSYNGYLKIDNLSVEYKSGNIHSREVMVKDNAVCALIYDKIIDRYILVKQWRPASESSILEIVAGTLDIPNEDPIDALKREVLEETGYLVDSTELIGTCFVSPGCTTEFLSIFYC